MGQECHYFKELATCFPVLTLAEGGKSHDFLRAFILYNDLNFQVKKNYFLVSELSRESYEAGMPGNKEQMRRDRKI